MDKLGQQLITLELAIPGLYATVLEFTKGDAATTTRNLWLYFRWLLIPTCVFFWAGIFWSALLVL